VIPGFKKEVGVGFFRVAVQEGKQPLRRHRQVGGDGGLAGAALAVGEDQRLDP
jgi:hypothetical protein